MEEQLGRPLEEIFSSISERPIAAASIGQVRRWPLLLGVDVRVLGYCMALLPPAPPGCACPGALHFRSVDLSIACLIAEALINNDRQMIGRKAAQMDTPQPHQCSIRFPADACSCPRVCVLLRCTRRCCVTRSRRWR